MPGSARRIWNARFDRRPGLIVRCADTADVQRTVDFVRAERFEFNTSCRSECALLMTAQMNQAHARNHLMLAPFEFSQHALGIVPATDRAI